jgi:deoxyribodipyrimidine photolyase-like uncharacterized protein
MNDSKVLVEQKGHTLLIGLNRADKYNAADMELLEQLSLAYGKLDSDPKLRVGDTACPFTTLYWDFLDRHKDTFVKNHRMSQQVFGLNRLKDLPELRERAQQVLNGLDQGTI